MGNFCQSGIPGRRPQEAAATRQGLACYEQASQAMAGGYFFSVGVGESEDIFHSSFFYFLNENPQHKVLNTMRML